MTSTDAAAQTCGHPISRGDEPMTDPRKIAHYGWIPDLPDERDHIYASPPQFLSALPPSTDLRPRCPLIYDEGMLGSCTANAISFAIGFYRLMQTLHFFLTSQLVIYLNEMVFQMIATSVIRVQI